MAATTILTGRPTSPNTYIATTGTATATTAATNPTMLVSLQTNSATGSSRCCHAGTRTRAAGTSATSGASTATTCTTASRPPAPPPPPPEPALRVDEPADGCDPNYSGCVPIASDVDCAGGSGNGPAYTGPTTVIGTNIYDLDRDGDGVDRQRASYAQARENFYRVLESIDESFHSR